MQLKIKTQDVKIGNIFTNGNDSFEVVNVIYDIKNDRPITIVESKLFGEMFTQIYRDSMRDFVDFMNEINCKLK